MKEIGIFIYSFNNQLVLTDRTLSKKRFEYFSTSSNPELLGSTDGRLHWSSPLQPEAQEWLGRALKIGIVIELK